VLDVLGQLEAEGRPTSNSEKQTLARWSSWGAIPEVFDPRHADGVWRNENAQLHERFSDEQWRQARRTTINAHYTDPNYVIQHVRN